MKLPIVSAACAAALFAAPVRAETPFVPHTDAEIARLTEYRGPARSEEILSIWRGLFLGMPGHRAFAVSPDGAFGTAWSHASREKAAEGALKYCAAREAKAKRENACAVYAADAEIVHPGAAYALREISFSVGDFTSGPEYFYRGPERAKGVIVWQHGKHGTIDQRKGAAYPIVNRLNLAGWDILRFDRDPDYDQLWWALSHLESSLPQLKALGYKRIVLAGQSRGAIQSLHILENAKAAPLVDAVLATAPAENGTGSASVLSAPDEWRQTVERLPAAPRIAIAFFGKDPYNPQAEEKAALARQAFAARGQAAVVIYENDPRMLVRKDADGNPSGHYGAATREFTDKYADCLEAFLDTGAKSGACAAF
ncbi:hypothetical protein [Oleispirillum naphthae]|uniref:hypothetical protein n=1 Tax=Oleispirillum naphthae TaxID=2838853 RepID=UPI0030825247